MKPALSVIIRAKNEERWIGRCLAAVAHQDHPNFEVIIVDNDSIDRTREIVEGYAASASHPCKIVTISDAEFTYGRALNRGIAAAAGEIIISLSGHCIPSSDHWLSALAANFTHDCIAGVYGKQEPLPDSDPFDKRDLWITFGQEKRIQEHEPFFHNANSAFRRVLWERFPFDESLHGQEDRDWAKKVLAAGYRIIYEPHAAVHHHHGIHHGRNPERAKRVVRVIEMLNGGNV